MTSLSKSLLQKALPVLLGLCACSLAFASDGDGIFDIKYPESDLSLTYLNFLFGPLSNQGLYLTPNALYYLLVKILIFPLFFASLMASWIIFSGTLHSAQEGSFLGQKLGSTSVVIRSTIGMGLLTPDHTGYALIQKAMMSIILCGIGLANTLWGMVTEQYAKGMSLMAPIQYDATDQAYAQQMIGVAALVSYLQQTGYIESELFQADPFTQKFQQLTVTPVAPSSDPGAFNLSFYTGSKPATIPDPLIAGTSSIVEVFIGQPLVQTLVQWMILNPTTVIDVNTVFVKAGISSQDLNAWMIANYEITRQQMSIISEERSNDIEKYLEQGWLAAGSIYWKLSSGGSGDNKSYTSSLYPSPTTGVPDNSTTGLQHWLTKLNSIMYTSNTVLSTSILNIQNGVAVYGADEANGIVRPDNPIDGSVGSTTFAFTALNNCFKHAINDGKDPIIEFAKDSQKIMKGIIVFFITTLVLVGALSLIAVCRWQLPLVHTMVYALVSILILVMSFSFVLIPSAAMGGYYLPMVPLLIYTGAAIAWFIKVIEAIVAVPFVAVALIEPTQDEFGRAKAALVLTLHVMLKPALMVIGLFLGGRLATIALASLSLPLNAFMTYKSFLISSSNSVLERTLFYIFLDPLIISAVIAFATRSFALIYKLPDQVFGWIGHRGHNSEVASMVQEAHQGAEQGIQMMNQIFQIGTAVGKVALDGMKAAAPK